jgi:hypothetical protein
MSTITHVEISYRETARTKITRHKRNALRMEIVSWLPIDQRIVPCFESVKELACADVSPLLSNIARVVGRIVNSIGQEFSQLSKEMTKTYFNRQLTRNSEKAYQSKTKSGIQRILSIDN